MDSWAGFGGLPFPEGQGQQSLWVGTGAGRAEACGENGVRAGSGRWQRCLEVTSSILLPLGPAPADGILPAEDPRPGALSRKEHAPAVIRKASRSSSQFSLEASWTKRHASGGLQGACTFSWWRRGSDRGPRVLTWPAPGKVAPHG